MNDYCDLCGIGIGKSKIIHTREDGTKHIEHFNHMESTSRSWRWNKKRLHICYSCFEELNEMKKPSKYIREQLDASRKEKDL